MQHIGKTIVSTAGLWLLSSVLALSTAAAFIIVGPLSLTLDDGSMDNSVGISGGGQFLWFNRFTPAQGQLPLQIEQVEIVFPASVQVGAAIDVVFHEDRDGDGDPGTGAVYLATHGATVTNNDGVTFNTYAINPPVVFGSDSGDVLVGVINRSGGPGIDDAPAALDQTSSQGRSWVVTYQAGDVPAQPSYPSDGIWTRIDAFEPGNWLLRIRGSTLAAVCGDSAVELDEDCDDGNAVDDGNGCDATCRRNDVCGDGAIQGLYESCDDGDDIDSGNGCDETCQRNDACGDGAVQELYEACDDGNTADDGNGCDGACGRNDVCGDGAVQELYEDCDDGNTADDGNGCDDACGRNDVCGDGAVQELYEDCDDGNAADGACGRNDVCGDGIVQELYEACDDGNTVDDGNGCDENCQANNICGDGTVQEPIEECDDGNGTDDGNGCDDACGRNDVCGDGAVQDLYEQCDDGTAPDEGNGCDETCQRNDVCGDGAVQDLYEECDDGNTASGDGCDSACATEAPPPPADDSGGCCQGSGSSGSLPLLGIVLIGIAVLTRRRRASCREPR